MMPKSIVLTALVSVLVACGSEPSTAPRAAVVSRPVGWGGYDAASAAKVVAVTRVLAHALGDTGARSAMLSALARSPMYEHKVTLKQFLATSAGQTGRGTD